MFVTQSSYLVNPSEAEAHRRLLTHIDQSADEILRFQRRLHRNPERSWHEFETTRLIRERLQAAGLQPEMFEPTGMFVDLGADAPSHRIGLRADLDALPLQERTGLAWTSNVPGVSHSCGHDVHTAALLGATLALAQVRRELCDLGIGVRCFFQPAEETHPSGARMVRDTGAVDLMDAVFALHCDPATDLGYAGLRVGPITAASDRMTIRITGDGGHTSRPHLTQDVVFALAKVVTDLPAALTRVLDVRSNVLVAWGAVHSGEAENVIPDSGEVRGTLRLTDAALWEQLAPVVRRMVTAIVAPYGVQAEVEYHQGVPPVVNTASGVDAARLAVTSALGTGAVTEAVQSMGGEDFAWMLQGHDGALVRLGTRTPGGVTFDLHRGDLVVDPRSVLLAARLYATLPFAARTVLLHT